MPSVKWRPCHDSTRCRCESSRPEEPHFSLMGSAVPGVGAGCTSGVLAFAVDLSCLPVVPREPFPHGRGVVADLDGAEGHNRSTRPPHGCSFSLHSLEEKTMNEHRRQILQMLSEGKISADQAERLIAASEQPTTKSSADHSESSAKSRPKYLRVQVDSEGNH